MAWKKKIRAISPNYCHNSFHIYYNLLTSGKSTSCLADVELQAQHLFSHLVKDLTEKENVTEELNANDMLLWAQRMNNIRNRATEIVNAELMCF